MNFDSACSFAVSGWPLNHAALFARSIDSCYIELDEDLSEQRSNSTFMNSVRIPSKESCMALLKRYDTPEHIIQHSERVWEVGRLLGLELIKRNLTIDMDLIRASCLLHDVGKYPCILDGSGFHDIRGEQILEIEGFPNVARIVVQHVILRSSLDDPIAEEHVLFYADKRVVHDVVVSLEERFEYLVNTYGKTPQAIEGLCLMKENTFKLEKRLFLHLDFKPDDLNGLLDHPDLRTR